MKKFFVFLIAVIFCACQTPYSGDLGPKDFNGWIESNEGDTVCLWNGFDRLCYVKIRVVIEKVIEKVVIETKYKYLEVEKIVKVVEEKLVYVERDTPPSLSEVVAETVEALDASEDTVIKEIPLDDLVNEIGSELSSDGADTIIKTGKDTVKDTVKNPPPQQKSENPSAEEAAALIEKHWVAHTHQPHSGKMVADSFDLDYDKILNLNSDDADDPRIAHAHEKGTDADGFYIGYVIKNGKIRHARSRDRNETPKLVRRLVVHSHGKPNFENEYR